MSIIKKSIFENKTNIEEFVDSDGAMIGGDRNVNNNSEIETGPVQKSFNDDSEYEKGVSTTTDKAARYRQNIPWFATYSYSGNRGIRETKSRIIKKKQVEEKIDDLTKKGRNVDIIDKGYNSTVDKIISSIDDNDFSSDDIEKIKAFIQNKQPKNSEKGKL